MTNLVDIISASISDHWCMARVGNKKYDSYIRALSVDRHYDGKAFIKLFCYYPKTGKIELAQISKIDHLFALRLAKDMSEDLERRLNTMYAKYLLVNE
jgi:hypothetical protein